MTQPEPQPAPELPGRWVRYIGPETRIVAEVGEWVVGEVKHVAGQLAERLLRHPYFEPANPTASPVADAAAPEVPAEPAVEEPKPARSKRATTEPTAPEKE